MAKLSVCVSVILVLLVALVESRPSNPCCTQFQEKPVAVKMLKYYRIQDIDYCNLKAIIFKTVRNRVFCANPNEQWVIDAIVVVPYKP